MSTCDQQLPLDAYHDGELDPADRVRVEEHLRACPSCAAALERLRETSAILRQHRFDDLTDDERRDLHLALDEADDRQVWRLGATLGLVAASILIIGLAWLNALPAGTPVGPGGGSGVVVVAPAQPWERVAITLRADPLPHPDQAYDQTRQLAEARLTEMMLQGLTPAKATP